MYDQMICVDVKAYMDDLYEYISEEDRAMIVEKLCHQFDYTNIYSQIDEWISYYCREQNIVTDEEEYGGFRDDDAELEAFSLDCAFGPND